jgi:hypothetical protein
VALHFPPASGFGLLDTVPAAPDLSPALQVWRDWLLGRPVRPGVDPAPPEPPGAELAEALARQPALIDWLFPADDWVQPFSDAPVLHARDVRALIAPLDPLPPDPAAPWRRARLPERTLDARILPVYVRWLALLGLSLDHHGALEPRGTPPHPDWAPLAWRPWQRQAVLRVVRFLQLAGWQGHSLSDPLSLVDSHADHLARWARDATGERVPGFALALQRALAEDPALVTALERALMHPTPRHAQQALAACLQQRRFLPGLDLGGISSPTRPEVIAAGRVAANLGHRIEPATAVHAGMARAVVHWRWIVRRSDDGQPALHLQALDACGKAARAGEWLTGPGGQRVAVPQGRAPARAGETA